MTKSVIQNDKSRCYICGRPGTSADPLDEHHVFFGPYRKQSEKDGLKVYLHHFSCHIFGPKSVHANSKICRALQSEIQSVAMKIYGWSIKDFIRRYGKNYIENIDTCIVCGEYVPEGSQLCPRCIARSNVK